jgi:hypothetical protein
MAEQTEVQDPEPAAAAFVAAETAGIQILDRHSNSRHGPVIEPPECAAVPPLLDVSEFVPHRAATARFDVWKLIK